MADLYITKNQLTNAAVADEADNAVVWDLLAESVSRMFDRECEVTDGYFAPAGPTVSPLTYRTDGTKFLRVSPYIVGTITSLTVDGVEYFGSSDTTYAYREKDGYIVFDYAPVLMLDVVVTARYGFGSVAADIQQACLEQANLLERKKDPAFAEISGVASVITMGFSPTFVDVAKRYREIYSSRMYFA